MSRFWRTQLIRGALHLLLIVAALVIQTSVLATFPFLGVRPDLILVLVLSIGLLRGPGSGVGVAVVGGLLSDILSGQMIGLSVVVLSMIGLVAGSAGLRIVGERLPLSVLFSAGATLLFHLLYAGGTWAFGIRLPLIDVVAAMLPPLVLYNSVSSLLIHPALARMYKLLDAVLIVPRQSIPNM